MQEMPCEDGKSSFSLDQPEEVIVLQKSIDFCVSRYLSRHTLAPYNLLELSSRVNSAFLPNKGRRKSLENRLKEGADGCVFIDCAQALLATDALAQWLSTANEARKYSNLKQVGHKIISVVSKDYKF